MKATIILLAYNQERTIVRAIESLLCQRCDYPYEILIAEDDSPDSTRRLCEEYARRHPDLIRLMPPLPNKGIVGNYFDALMAAEGEYVGDCAGDDEWLDPTRLQRSIEALDNHPGCSVVFTDVEQYHAVDGKMHLIHSSLLSATGREEIIPAQKILDTLLDHTDALPYILSAALYRRSVLLDMLAKAPDIVRNPEAGIEDIPVIAALTQGIDMEKGKWGGDAIYLPLTGYRYHIEGESASNNLSHEKAYRLTARVATLIRRMGEYYGYTPRQQSCFFRQKFTYMATQIRHSLNPELAEDFRRRLAQWPDMRLPLRGRIHMLLYKIRHII